MDYLALLFIWGSGVAWILLRLIGIVKPSRNHEDGSNDEIAKGSAWFISFFIGTLCTTSLLFEVFGTIDGDSFSGLIFTLAMVIASVWLGYKFANWIVFGD